MTDLATLVLDADTKGLKNAASDLDAIAATSARVARDTGASLASIGERSAKAGAGLTIGLTAPLVAFGKSSYTAAVESQQALAQVESALDSMGARAGFNAKQLQNLAGGLQDISNFDDDDILKSVTANILTFGNITGKALERAQLSVVNLSARLGTDLQGATLQVGKALNDPIKGLSALGRAGIQFTDVQKNMVKGMVAAGNVAGAQNIILGELEKQFGGAAKAQRDATPSAGSLQQWRTLQEIIGDRLIGAVETLAPYVERVAASFNNLTPGMQTTIVVTGAIVAAIGPLLIAFGAVAFGASQVIASFGAIRAASVLLFTNPVLLGAAALIAGIVYVWRDWDSLPGTINPVTNAVRGLAEGLGLAQSRVNIAASAVSADFAKISKAGVESGVITKEAADKIIAGLGNISATGKIDPAVTASLTEITQTMKNAGVISAEEAKKITGDILKIYSAEGLDSAKSGWSKLGKQLLAFSNQMDAWVNVFDAQNKAAADKANATWNAYGIVLKELGSRFYNLMLDVGRQVVNGFTNGIKSKFNAAKIATTSVVQSVWETARSFNEVRSPSRLYMRLGGFLTEGLALGIEAGEGRAVGAVLRLNAATGTKLEELKARANSILGQLFPDIAKAQAFEAELKQSKDLIAEINRLFVSGALGAGDYAKALEQASINLKELRLNQLPISNSADLPTQSGSVLPINFEQDLIASLPEIKKVGQSFGNIASDIQSASAGIANAIDDIKGSISGFIDSVKKGDIAGIFGGIANIIGVGFSLFSGGQGGSSSGNSQGILSSLGSLINGNRVLGGNVSAGKSYIVGEKRPEIFTPQTSGRISPNAGSGAMDIRVTPSKYFDIVVNGVVQKSAPAIAVGGAQLANSQSARARLRDPAYG